EKSPELKLIKTRPTRCVRNIRLASYPPKGKESESMMLQIPKLLNRMIIFILFIIFILVENSLTIRLIITILY
ncbi:hypothetical protein SPM24T3_24057, partial [Serratia sp. M24T3]